MSGHDPSRDVANEGLLRQRAEERLHDSNPEVSLRSPADQEALIHELQVHQIELDIQNEELRQAQVELAAVRDRYLELFEFAPVGYLTLDARQTIREANLAAAALLGVDRAELVGARLPKFLDPVDADTCHLHFQAVADSREPSMSVLTFRRPDGTPVVVQIESVSALPEDGSDAVLRSTMTDITERQRSENARLSLERQMLHSQKLQSLGVLAGGVAHDFNNLLMIIQGNTSLALMEVAKESLLFDNLQEIDAAASRAADLTRQMLAYAGKGSFDIRTVDLCEIVLGMRLLLHASVPKKADLRFDLPANVLSIDADVSQLRQVLLNVVINASEAVGPDSGGSVTVAAYARQYSDRDLEVSTAETSLTGGRHICLEVRDTGCGMDQETRSRIFEPFFSTKLSGRGLGLSAVMGIMTSHNGAVMVESGLGSGTSVRLVFPCAREFAAELPPAQLDDWRGSGLILLVEDESVVRKTVANMLVRLGFQVLTAAEGQDAVDLFADRCSDIAGVLLDMTMPRMSGAEALTAIRALDPAARVIVASGYTEEDLRSRFTANGPDLFLMKPYTLDNLRAALRQLLGEPDLQAEPHARRSAAQ